MTGESGVEPPANPEPEDAESLWERLTLEEKDRDIQLSTLGEVLRLTGDGPITSDWHLPLTDFRRVEQMVQHCERLHCGQWCIIAGDLFNQDALSDHMPKQKGADFTREIDVANRVVKRLMHHFDRVYITLGNHDERMAKRMGHVTDFARTVRMCLHELTADQQRRLIVTNRDHVIVDSDEGPWLVAHSRSYSKQPLAYPGKLADRHRMNVASGHRHHCALGFSSSGYRIAEIPALYDAARTEYLHRYTSDFPLGQVGHMILRKGRIICPALSGDV